MSSREQPRILVFYDKPQEFLPELCQRFPAAEFFTCESYDDLELRLTDARPNIVLAYKFEPRPFPRDAILSCPTLEWLSVGFAGVDHIVPWDEKKILVTNAAGVAAEEMAQYALSVTFGLYQQLPVFARNQAARQWKFRLVRSARGATVGLLGLGHTGTAIARHFRALGHRVLACRSRPQPSVDVDAVFQMEQLDEMLALVDVVIVCAALTPKTRDLFDGERFNAMKKGSYFVNMARGEIVQENALLHALTTGRLAGAAIDVARIEPLPAESPLWDVPNLLITPHTSSEYEGWFRDAALMFADNLQRWIAKQPLENQVSSDRGY